MKMLNNSQKRAAFLQRFEGLRIQKRLEPLPPWFEAPSPDDNIMATWILSSQLRVMNLQEADEDRLFGFDFFISRVGIDDELLKLGLNVKDTPGKARLILEIHRLWFADQMAPDRIEPLLREFVRAYAEEGAKLASDEE